MASLYAIVSSLERALFFLDVEVPYLQLRFKEESLAAHTAVLQEWVLKYPKTRLIINDDVELAHKVGAWGVHLGQEDLECISKASFPYDALKLGISTHSDEEIQSALDWNPDYLGFGPIFSTNTKTLSISPQGLERLQQVVEQCSVPIVAIGGIDLECYPRVSETGVHAIAMISALDEIHSLQAYRQCFGR